MINTPPKPPRFWRRQAPLPPKVFDKNTDRSIPGGPLLDLAEIQQAFKNNEFTADSLWIATDCAEKDLLELGWEYERVCDLVCVLQSADYRASEWARSSSNSTHACDAYSINFDDVDRTRDWRGPEYYIKFSINPAGLTICVMSCHLSRG